MKELEFKYEGQQITFSELDGENELRIDIEDGYMQPAVQYLCLEQVIALKDYLIKQLNNLPNELKGVSNNEQKKKVCSCKEVIEVHFAYKCKDCGTLHEAQ